MSKHIIMSEAGGSSFLEEMPAPAFTPADFPGWSGLSLEDSGVFLFMFDIAPDAVEFPLHTSPDEWLAYVVAGAGELVSGEGETRQLESVPFAAGDFITFRANTPHAWRNGGVASRILFVKRTS